MHFENVALWPTTHYPRRKLAWLWTKSFCLLMNHIISTYHKLQWAHQKVNSTCFSMPFRQYILPTFYHQQSFFAQNATILRSKSRTNYWTTSEELQDHMKQLLINYEILIYNDVLSNYSFWLRILTVWLLFSDGPISFFSKNLWSSSLLQMF